MHGVHGAVFQPVAGIGVADSRVETAISFASERRNLRKHR
jgi:hypothetical protein